MVEGARLAILSALEIAVVIAGPAIGMMILVELLIGWLGRMSQGLQTHFVAMPARAAAGLFGLALALSFVPPRLHGWIRAALDASTRLP